MTTDQDRLHGWKLARDAILHPQDQRMANVVDAVRLADLDVGEHDDPAMSDDGMYATELAYGLAMAHGDDDAMSHTVAATCWTIGDPGLTGERIAEGHAKVPLLRHCIGNAERCWLIPLDAILKDAATALKPIRDFYVDAGYER